MLGTDPVLPLAMAVLELLGLLGPEPGALLQREETGGRDGDRGQGQNRVVYSTYIHIYLYISRDIYLYLIFLWLFS